MATSGIPDTSLPPPPGLPREERLDSIAALIRAQDDVIALARRHVKVFDIDLSWGGWNASARCAALGSYMRRIPGARLSIIVHDTHWIEASGASWHRLTWGESSLLIDGATREGYTIHRRRTGDPPRHGHPFALVEVDAGARRDAFAMEEPS